MDPRRFDRARRLDSAAREKFTMLRAMQKRLPSLLCISLLAAMASCGGPPEPPTPPATGAPPQAATSTNAGAPAGAKAGVTKRVVVSLGRPSGTDVITTTADGSIKVAFDVLENGRGPHVDATLRLAPDGTIASFDGRGHHTMGTPVAETFAREGNHARWKSHEEQGDREVSGAAFFVPVCEFPDALGFLAEALFKRGTPLPLLPAGEARLEKTGEATVRSSAGTERRILGYAITGLDLTPTRVWMNEDGTWFAYVMPWFSVIPEGFEGSIEPLIEKQNQLDKERDAKLAKDTAHKPPAAGLAYTHARVLDVERGAWLADQTVVVTGSTITAVGPAASTKVPAGAETVDLAGKALVPGLWDMHSHLSDPDGALDIASGVTTARDVGNDPDKLDDWKKRFDDGSAVGPRVIRYGFIEGRGEKAASSKVTAENEAEAKAAVETYFKRGYEGIKIYNSMKPELVPLLAKEAHARGMGVTGHIPVHMLANEAVRAGYDGIEHVNMLFLNFFADHETDTRTPLRFTLVGDKAASLDLKSKPVADFIKLLRERHTVIDPTVGVFEELLMGRPGKVTPGVESLAARLPVQTQRSFLLGGVPMAGKEELYAASFAKVLAMVKLLRDEKIPMVIGTDAYAGLYVHHELALFVRAGIPAAEAIRMATLDAARSMKQEKKSGSIAVGKNADLFVVDGDPLAHIEDIGNVSSTMRGGVVFASAPLYEAVGVRAKR
jgi:Amidohydrolase family